jgi:hypothetical protein
MENKVVHKGKVIWMETEAVKCLWLEMPNKPEEGHMAHTSFPLSGAFGLIAVEEIFKPYLGKDISITFERKEGKVHSITIESMI